MRTNRSPATAAARAALITVLLLGLALLCCGRSRAAAPSPAVRVDISGDLTESHRRNIRSHLALARAAEAGPLSTALFNRLYGSARGEAARALEPFGYYDPDITLSKRRDGDGWLVHLEVDTGRPVVIEDIRIEVSGAGEQDPVLRRTVERLTLRTGEVLDHPRYETAKEALIVRAIDSGYLKAAYTASRVEIRRKDYAAAVHLRLDTGPRYVFGPITFSRDTIDHDLLRKILPVREGAPLTPKNLARLRQSLFNVGYFSTVDLDYDLETGASAQVPVRVELTPAPAHKYAVGLGYGTDTGIRSTLEYANRYVNSLGHQLDLRLQPSERKSTFSSAYTIPLGDPRRDRLSLLASYEIENYDNIESNLFKSTVSRDHFRERGEFSTYLQYLDERYDTGLDSGHAALFIPGVRGVLYLADDRVNTTHGLRLAGLGERQSARGRWAMSASSRPRPGPRGFSRHSTSTGSSAAPTWAPPWSTTWMTCRCPCAISPAATRVCAATATRRSAPLTGRATSSAAATCSPGAWNWSANCSTSGARPCSTMRAAP